MEPHNIEVTSFEGACRWICNIVSHTPKEIEGAWMDGEMIVVKDLDDNPTAINLAEAFVIRFQDEETFKRRSKQRNGRRRPQSFHRQDREERT